jgi:hypothetical protein
MTEPICRVFLVGLGRTGMLGLEGASTFLNQGTHLGYILSDSRLELVGVWDNSENARSIFKETITGQLAVNDDLASVEAECFVIATPEQTHLSIIRCIAKNKRVKVILCEKPLGHSANDATEIEKILLKNAISCVVNYPRSHSIKRIPFYNDLSQQLNGSYPALISATIADSSKSALPHLFNLLLTLNSNFIDSRLYGLGNHFKTNLKIVMGKLEEIDIDFKFIEFHKREIADISILTSGNSYSLTYGFSSISLGDSTKKFGWGSTDILQESRLSLINESMKDIYDKAYDIAMRNRLDLSDVVKSRHTHTLVSDCRTILDES